MRKKTILNHRGGFREGERGGGGGGGGRTPSSSGIRPPADPKGPPLILFQKSIFGRPTLKFFLRRLRRQYILTLRGSARQKTHFFVKIFQKVPKNDFFDCFFKHLPIQGKTVLWENSKNQFGRPKKKRSSKFSIFFLNPPRPRENPRSAPAEPCTNEL